MASPISRPDGPEGPPASPAPGSPEGGSGGRSDGERSEGAVLSGWFERRGVSPALVAFFALAAVFILFQAVGAAAGGILLLAKGGVPEGIEQAELFTYLTEEAPEILLLGNSVGQVLGLALPVAFLARLHTPQVSTYLRVRSPDPAVFTWALVGWVGLVPIVQILERANRALPLPEAVRVFDRRQMELVEQVLASDLGLALNVVALAVVPALCEELLFRGYVQRNLERTAGAVRGFLITGFVFAIYHLRFTQILPLALLGCYLGYVLWRSRSVWTAVAVHFANNAFAVLLGSYAKRSSELEIDSVGELPVPLWTVLLGGAIVTGAIVALERAAFSHPQHE